MNFEIANDVEKSAVPWQLRNSNSNNQLVNTNVSVVFYHQRVHFSTFISLAIDAWSIIYMVNFLHIVHYFMQSILSNFHSFRLQLYDGNTHSLSLLSDANFRGAFIAPDLLVAYYNMINRNSEFVYTSQERIFNLPFVIYLRRHSCLTATINKHIHRLTSSGIITNWIETYQDIRFTKIKIVKTPKTLTMGQVQGVFLICSVLYSFASAVFLLEMLSMKFKVIRICFQHFQ